MSGCEGDPGFPDHPVIRRRANLSITVTENLTRPDLSFRHVGGISFSGFGAVTQTAIARLAPDSMDVAQSMCPTAWNSAVALGGVVDGFLLDRAGAGSFPVASAAILAVSLVILIAGVNRPLARRH